MKTKTNLLAILLVALGGPGMAVADDKKDETEKSPAKAEQPAQKAQDEGKVQVNGGGRTAPIYIPPLRGAPLSRVGGGTRGIDDSIPVVSVVTPEHTGYTSASQPRLYWYLSEKHAARIEVVLINDHDIDPVLETALSQKIDAGINRIDLKQLGVTLKPGVAYRWSVALVSDAAQRSSDIIASGRVQYAELSDVQRGKLQNASPEQAVTIFAQAGYWYDAFATLSEQIERQPGNQSLRLQRIALLEQVGLDEAAAFDRSQLMTAR